MFRDRIHTALIFAVLVLLLAALLAVGCGGSDATTTTAPATASTEGDTTTSVSTSADSGEVILEVVGPTGTKSYTLEQLKAAKVTEGYGGMKSSTGKITPPTVQTGVLIEDLLADVGGLPDDMAVSIVAKDGYEMTISATQLRSGDFLTYDMVTGAEKTVDGPLQAMLCYQSDGRTLNPESEGTLRLGIVGEKKDQVTDGHWWVKWVTKIEVKPIEQEWSLSLAGTLQEEIDKATFESGANPGCHGQSWTDADGNTWSGLPLYLLVGRVDDEVAHEGPAYNRELAKSGYDVQIIDAAGKLVTVSSEAMFYNKSLIVADKLNGEALSEDYWPLRLVGDGIDAVDYIGQIAEIKLLLPTD
jgi:DMSO/TMAO reductase YedYZ molybdopterin-dependent catalytic subunit